MLRPSDVFTTDLPVAPQNVYSPRGKPEDRLAKCLRRGRIALVFGEYGVGKTSMVRRALKNVEGEGRLVNITNLAGKTFGDVIASLLEKLGYMVEISRTHSDSSETNRGLSGSVEASTPGLKFAVKAERKAGSENVDTIQSQMVVTSPTDERVLHACNDAGLYLMLDELHRADPQLKSQLAVFMKTLAGLSLSRFRLVILGTSTSATELVTEDPGVDRLFDEVEVSPMTEPEGQFLVRKGMYDLEIDISEDQVVSLVEKAVGAPVVLQYLCVEVAEVAFGRSPRQVEGGDVDNAVSEYMATQTSRLANQYAQAISTTGPTRYRNLILDAMAVSAKDYVTLDEIRSYISRVTGLEVKVTSLSKPLGELKDKQYGALLKDVVRRDGGKVHNLNVFTNPAMKAYVRARSRFT